MGIEDAAIRPARQIGRRGRHRHGRLSQIQGLSPRTPQWASKRGRRALPDG
jgi:hypothetical protein